MKLKFKFRWKEIIHYWTALVVSVILVVTLLPFGNRAFAATDTGYKDFSYLGATPDTGAFAPTGQKPQSKLWYNDENWWGVLFNKTTIRFEIYRFNWSTQSWSSTGAVVDTRSKSSADALWDGSKLFIVSAVPPEFAGTNNSIYLERYSYDTISKSYSLDSGFPVSIAVSAIETVVMDKDSTGKLWVTYTDDNGLGGRQVLVTHTTTDDYTWLTPFQIPTTGANNLNIDDISTLVSYSNKIGVMWSNQTDNSVYFAIHNNGDPDTTWTLNPAIQGPRYADDHLNIKSLQADPSGQVFAVVKTSLSDNTPPNPSDPLILLLKLDNQGAWTRRTFGTVADNHTRPILLIDQENREIYVFATAQYSSQFSGAIYYKKVSLDSNSMQFPTGLGTPFIEFAADTHINNATSTKQPLNSTSDLLVVASDDNSHFYFHNVLDLSPNNAGPLFSDGFESGNFSAWTEIRTTAGASAIVQSSTVKNGSFAAQLSETNKSASRAYIRTNLAVPQTELTTNGYFLVTQEGTSGGNVPILKLYNPSGGQILSLFRKNLDSNRVYVTDLSATRLTSASLPLNTWAKFQLYIKTTGAGTSTIEVSLNDTIVLSTTTANLGTVGVGSVLIGNDVGGQPFNLVADDILIRRGSPYAPAATATPTITPTAAFSPTPTFTPVVSTFFADDFESGNLLSWDLAVAGGDGSVSIQNATVKNGNFAAKLSATVNTGSNAFARKVMSSPEVDITATGYFMITQEGASGANIPIFRLFDLSGNRLISLYRQNLDLNKVYFTDLSGAKTIVSGTMPLNTWTKFDLHVINSGAGTSTMDIYMNSGLVYHSTTANLGSSGVSVIQIGNDTARQAFTLFADDISISRGYLVIIPTTTPTPVPPTTTYTPTVTLIPPTSTPTNTATNTATNTPTDLPLPTATYTPTATPTDAPTNTPTNTPTDTPVPTTTSTPTDVPTNTPTNTPTDIVPTNTATDTPLPTATYTPTATPADAPTNTPTDTPVPTATSAPLPTDTPTSTSTSSPILFGDGFESSNFAAWSLVKTGGDGAALVQSTTVKTGTYAAQLSETANTGSLAYIRASLSPSQTNITISLDIMIAQEGASGGNVPILRLFDSAGTRLISLYRQNLSGNRIWITHSGTSYSTPGLLSLNTWSHFDIHLITAGTGASTIEVYQNGTLIYQTTTASLGSSGIVSAQIGNDTAKQIFTLFADNVQISK